MFTTANIVYISTYKSVTIMLLYTVVLPAWTYTLGTILSNRANISLPFLSLIGNLFVTIGPCLLGLFLAYKYPKLKVFCFKIVKV
jgi:hypothetical protein